MTETPDIDTLVSNLSSDESIVRQQARHDLVRIGAPATEAIQKLADSDVGHVRWECAKTLAAIGDPASTDTLIKLLEDPDNGTVWDAALGLITIGKPAAKPLLRAVIDRTSHFSIIAGAHHALHEMSENEWGASLKPVYEALHSSEPGASAPVAAAKALDAWED